MRYRIAAVVVALVTLTGVATSTTASAAPTNPVTLTFAARLTNISNNTQTFGALQYGVVKLQGASLVNGEEVTVVRDSVLEYHNGSGPIGGFVTVLWKDGSRISMRVGGVAVNTANEADFTATLDVFSTAGRWEGYIGSGIMRGFRPGKVGNPVTYTYRVKLERTK